MRRWYEVLSMEYTYEETIDYWIGGPCYETRDWFPVWAKNARRAKVAALKAWRRRGNVYNYPESVRDKVRRANMRAGEWLSWDDHVNPFSGMEAIPGPRSKSELPTEEEYDAIHGS